jgi:hypothetical protein
MSVGENVAVRFDQAKLHLFDSKSGAALREQLDRAGPGHADRSESSEFGGLVV